MWRAIAAYAAVAVIAHLTLDTLFRTVVWIFVGGLAVMTLARAKYGAGEESRE